MIKCSLDCLNFNDDKCCCDFGHKVFKIKNSEDYGTTDNNCEDYESIDEYAESLYNKGRNNMKTLEEEIEDETETIIEDNEIEDVNWEEDDEYEQPKPKFDIAKKVQVVRKPIDKIKQPKPTKHLSEEEKEFEEFQSKMEGDGLFNMFGEIITSEESDFEEPIKRSDMAEIDSLLDDDGSDDYEEQRPAAPQRVAQPKQEDDIDEFRSMDDFVTTTDDIDGWSDENKAEAVNALKGTKTFKQEPKREETENIAQQKVETNNIPTKRKANTLLAAEFEQFANDVKAGKIDLDTIYGGTTEGAKISDAEREAAEAKVRREMGL